MYIVCTCRSLILYGDNIIRVYVFYLFVLSHCMLEWLACVRTQSSLSPFTAKTPWLLLKVDLKLIMNRSFMDD